MSIPGLGKLKNLLGEFPRQSDMTQASPTQDDREQFCKQGYICGYNYFHHSFADYDNDEDISVLCNETRGNFSQSDIIRDIEEHFNFERGKHDWDNFGIYGLIEDVIVCYESGAKDALDKEEKNPERISHMWNY